MDLTDTIIPRSDQMTGRDDCDIPGGSDRPCTDPACRAYCAGVQMEWRPVPGYEGIYEVSDRGRVRSLDRFTSNGRRRAGAILKPIPMPRGYLFVNLWRANRKREWLVQRLVLTAFIGPQPAGMEALHRDNNPGNNTLTNLRWGTHSENQYDQVAHGTHRNASKDQCPAGHPYDATNTYRYPGRTKRGCRACRRDHARRRAA